jgi:hypothetical protein
MKTRFFIIILKNIYKLKNNINNCFTDRENIYNLLLLLLLF